MSRQRKMQFRLVTFVVLPALLALAALVPAFLMATEDAGALSSTQWDTVRNAINGYITGQYQSGAQGEAGYQVNQAWLKTRIDSNNDNVYLGEGDDAANAPVLIDNLRQQTNMIPATSFRCRWTETSAPGDCFTASSVNVVKNLVNNHEAAGFSTDIVDYCVTNHTAAPTTGAWGYIAQTGGLGGSTTPKVYGFKWGRNGWTNTVGSYTNTNPIGSAAATSTFSYATNSLDCSSETTDAGVVRCAAQWAVSASGGNVGNGKAPPITAQQIIDIRADSPAGTIGGAIQIPVNTIFNTGLSKVDPSKTTLVASRTQGVGGIVAAGLRMLGYDLNTSTGGGFLQNGMPGWNNTMDEKQVSTGVSYSLVTVTALTAPDSATATDTTAPVINNTTGTGKTGQTTANVVRNTSEPATSKIALTGSDGHVVNENNTVLNAQKTTALTGLHPGVTYSGTLTVYDAQANSASTPISFTTDPAPVADTTPPAATYTGPTGTVAVSDPTVTGTASDNVGVTGAHLNLNGGADISCTVTPSGGASASISCSTSGLTDGDYAAVITAHDAAGNNGTASGSFTVSLPPADETPPEVTYTGPSGTIYDDSPTVTGTATDNVGVEVVSLSLNGGAATDCSIDGSGNVSCPTSGLAAGDYTAVITAEDAAGNSATAQGTFTVAFAEPEMTLQTIKVYWASYADYQNRKLSVDMRINNIGEGTAVGMTVTHVTATNGVTLSTTLPLALGDIAAGGSDDFTLVYTVPAGVNSFNTTVFAKCQDTLSNWHYYPEGQDPPADPEPDMFQAKWDELNGAPGEPAGAVYDIPGGQAKNYANGRLIYNAAAGKVYWMYGQVLAKWDELGGPTSPFRLPVGDTFPYYWGGIRSNFQGGHIIWSPSTGFIVVRNAESYRNGW